jgi:hypothetical protein
MCERAVPGELLVARITALKKGGRFAEAIKAAVLVPSPHATPAPCPHFQRCGGCTWQEVSYAAQLAYKRGQVLDVLRRIAKVPDADTEVLVRDIVPSLTTERYRNKMEFAFSAGAAGLPATVGLRPSGSHSVVVPVLPEGCMLQHPTADAILARCHQHLREISGAAAALPAFDRRTGSGVLRSITIRTAPTTRSDGPGGSGGSSNSDDDGGHVLAMVDLAAAVDWSGSSGSGGTRGKVKTPGSVRANTKAALAALAADLATVPGVHSVVHTMVASEPELRLAEGRQQGWVKGGRGSGGGGARGGRGRGGHGSKSRNSSSGGNGGRGSSTEDGNDPSGGGGGDGGRGTTVLNGSPTLPITLRGVRFALSAPSFFQTNTSQAERLVEAVEVACGFKGDRSEVVLDLFCGVGTLGLCVASKVGLARGLLTHATWG